MHVNNIKDTIMVCMRGGDTLARAISRLKQLGVPTVFIDQAAMAVIREQNQLITED